VSRNCRRASSEQVRRHACSTTARTRPISGSVRSVIRKPAAILALLTGLNLLNYLDRLVLSAVLPKVQESLGLSNFVGGSLATVFLIGYFLTSPIFGQLADRGARKGIIAAGVAVWSIATFASGLATTALALVLGRAMVGVGEASYATLAPTIIDDMSPPDRKGRWLSVFYVAIPVGSALGYLTGGFVEKHYGWRAAFFVAGGPGILLAALCLLIQEPARKLAKEKVDLKAAFVKLWAVALYRRGVFGYCAQTFAIGGFGYWAPTFIYKRYGLDLATANFKFGLMTVVAGGIGTAVGGSWGDRWLRRRGDMSDESATRVNLRVCAIAGALAAPLAAACFLAPSATLFFVFGFGCELFLFLSTSPINAVILRSVPVEMRASAMALSIFGIHLLGDLWSPPLLGLLQDHLPVSLAMMAVPVAIGVSSFTWWTSLGAKRVAASA
jgi:MFS family permease